MVAADSRVYIPSTASPLPFVSGMRAIPSARVNTAMHVNAGDWLSLRNANRKSFMSSFHSKCLDGIDSGRSPRREITRGQCGTREHGSYPSKDKWIAWVDSVK